MTKHKTDLSLEALKDLVRRTLSEEELAGLDLESMNEEQLFGLANRKPVSPETIEDMLKEARDEELKKKKYDGFESKKGPSRGSRENMR